MSPRPPFRWAGGKRWALDALVSSLPPDQRFYRAPFVGGGALFWALWRSGRLSGAVLSDSSPVLIGTYIALRDRPGALIGRLQRHALNHGQGGKLYWSAVRSDFNRRKESAPLSLECAAALLYLQAVGFNGVYRENQQGEFNGTCDESKRPEHILNRDRLKTLQSCSVALQGVGLRVCDFSVALDAARPGDLVYADGPYDVPEQQQGGHVAYTRDGFTLADQVRLADGLARCVDRGVLVMASNADTPDIRRLYARWHTRQLWRKGNVSCRGDQRGAVPELLMTSWPVAAGRAA